MAFDPATAQPADGSKTFDPSTASLVPEAKRNPFAEVFNQLRAGTVVDVPKMVGQALQYTGDKGGAIHDYGQSIADSAEARGRLEENQIDPNAGGVTKFFAEGARMIPQSVAPAAAVGAGLAALPLSLPAGAVLGGAAVLGSLPAAMAQGQETLEKGRKAGIPEEQAIEAARYNALIEGGGETIGTWAGGKLLGVGGKAISKLTKAEGLNPYEAVIKQLSDKAIIKPTLKALPGTMATEIGTEMAQNYGQASVENAYGIDKRDPTEAAKEAIGPTAAMTLLLAPFGVVGRAHTVKQREKIVDDLANPDADLKDRVAAVQQVYSTLREHDPETAERFRANAGVALHERKPVTLSEEPSQNELTGLPAPGSMPPPGGGGISAGNDIERQQREQMLSDRNEAMWAARNAEQARRESAGLPVGPNPPAPLLLGHSPGPLSDSAALLPGPSSIAPNQYITDSDGNIRPATMDEANSQGRRDWQEYRKVNGPLASSVFGVSTERMAAGSQEAAGKRAEALRARTGIEHEVVPHPSRAGAYTAVPKAIEVQATTPDNIDKETANERFKSAEETKAAKTSTGTRGDTVSAGAQPADNRAPVSSVDFKTPDEIRQSEHEQYLAGAGVSPGVAKALASKEKVSRDVVTGFVNANADDGNGGVQPQTIKRAQEHIAQTGEQAFYVSADVANLGGLNTAMGNVKSKANAHYKAIANIMSDALDGTGGKVVPMRTGGDELGAVIVGGDREAVAKAIAEADKKIAAYAEANDLHNIPHPKRAGHKGVGLHIGFSEILTGKSPESIVNDADEGVNQRKEDVGGKQSGKNGSVPGEKPGAGGPARTGAEDRRAGKNQADAGAVPGSGESRGGGRSLDDESGQDHSTPQITGLPSPVLVDGQQVTFGSYQPARDAAEAYAKEVGFEYKPPQTYAKIDKAQARKIAQAYEEMKHDPNNPRVKAAYRLLAEETAAQYEAMLKTGITVEFFPDGIDTYGNPRNAILDVVNNNHLFIFPTDAGFGSGITAELERDNPLLAMSDYQISGRPARVNDLFRAVHDFFGHVKEGIGFRAEGEENAWRQHMAMFSPIAGLALTSETRGQNSWLNFGPHEEHNRTANGSETIYAEQKIGLMHFSMAEGWDESVDRLAPTEQEQTLEDRIDASAKRAKDSVKYQSDKVFSKLHESWDKANAAEAAPQAAESRAESGFTPEEKNSTPTPSFIKRHRIKADAYNVDTDQYEQTEMSAKEALAAVRGDITTIKALMKCLKG